MMEARLSALFKSEEDYTILDKFEGHTLADKKYKPLFPYFEQVRSFTFRNDINNILFGSRCGIV